MRLILPSVAALMLTTVAHAQQPPTNYSSPNYGQSALAYGKSLLGSPNSIGAFAHQNAHASNRTVTNGPAGGTVSKVMIGGQTLAVGTSGRGHAVGIATGSAAASGSFNYSQSHTTQSHSRTSSGSSATAITNR